MSVSEGATLTTQIIRAIRTQIDTRALTPGAKLPSVRKMAATKGVAPSTVVEAYERLAGEGLIRSRPGSGFYVAGPRSRLWRWTGSEAKLSAKSIRYGCFVNRSASVSIR
jgi:DNA-binding transcriptional regulator YhcF (GntR family)